VDTVTTGISAAGANQAGCTALTTQQNYVSTVATNTGVCLPAAAVGSHAYVCDEGANLLTVYAAAGSTINSLTSTVGVSVPLDNCAYFIGKSTTAWRTVP